MIIQSSPVREHVRNTGIEVKQCVLQCERIIGFREKTVKNHARSSHLFQIMRVLNAGQEEECTTHIAELSDFFFTKGKPFS